MEILISILAVVAIIYLTIKTIDAYKVSSLKEFNDDRRKIKAEEQAIEDAKRKERLAKAKAEEVARNERNKIAAAKAKAEREASGATTLSTILKVLTGIVMFLSPLIAEIILMYTPISTSAIPAILCFIGIITFIVLAGFGLIVLIWGLEAKRAKSRMLKNPSRK
jgi:chromatin remodeling complex protein RSC6